VEENRVTSNRRKREETLLSVPQEIQAIGQQEIEKAGLNTVDDLRALRADPDLQLQSRLVAVQSTFQRRRRRLVRRSLQDASASNLSR
jgi:hypothetical protein